GQKFLAPTASTPTVAISCDTPLANVLRAVHAARGLFATTTNKTQPHRRLAPHCGLTGVNIHSALLAGLHLVVGDNTFHGSPRTQTARSIAIQAMALAVT